MNVYHFSFQGVSFLDLPFPFHETFQKCSGNGKSSETVHSVQAKLPLKTFTRKLRLYLELSLGFYEKFRIINCTKTVKNEKRSMKSSMNIQFWILKINQIKNKFYFFKWQISRSAVFGMKQKFYSEMRSYKVGRDGEWRTDKDDDFSFKNPCHNRLVHKISFSTNNTTHTWDDLIFKNDI